MSHLKRSAVAAVLLFAGACLLMTAGWMWLAEEFSPLIATATCGGALVFAGLVVLPGKQHKPRPRRNAGADTAAAGPDAAQPGMDGQGTDGNRPDPPPTPFPALMRAFLVGIETYARVRDDLDRRR
ncbi:MAG: hypothetical protein ACXIU7_05470 [Roseinatronobacter sp.]